MEKWSEFDDNPRVSYYLSLRRDYCRPASQAHDLVKRMDCLVVGIQAGRHSFLQRLLIVMQSFRVRLNRWGGRAIYGKSPAQ